MLETTVKLEGHIIDSLTLPKMLDEVINRGGNYETVEVRIGRTKDDPSYTEIKVTAPSKKVLEGILERIQKLGAVPLDLEEVSLQEVEEDGVFPEGFYSTTNLETYMRLRGEWIPVEDMEMDCGIVVEEGMEVGRVKAKCIPVIHAKRGQRIVVGHRGIKVTPLKKDQDHGLFEFMSSQVSSEKPKWLLIKRLAEDIKRVRDFGDGKVLLVGGPAIVHTGAVEYVCKLIEKGYIHLLFAGNALAAHDIENALFGTSLGVSLEEGVSMKSGHENHLRAINRIRKYGGISKTVEVGALKKGIMYSCIKHRVDFVLAGSIRDDGPLPEVITDVIKAQDVMREKLRGVKIAIMVATMLHSIATSNLIPASVKTVCVDINPSVLTKLIDRGGIQAMGLLLDVESFFRELWHALSD